jgi:chromosome partitioning protein
MAAIIRNCSVCSVKFEQHFRYQIEERTEQRPDGESVALRSFYCSQRCLEASHKSRSDGQVGCDACARRFEVELAAQVLFTGGRRHYACSPICRSRVLEGMRAVRVGQLLDPNYQVGDDDATASSPSVAHLELMPALPPLPSLASLGSTVAAPAERPAPSPPAAPSAPLRPRADPPRTRARQQRVFAVFNHKGGTGKTTTAVHLAAGLALRGRRVLLVDTDGQGNVATSLGLKFERSLYHVLVMGLDYREALLQARPNLDVLPSNETVAAAELYLAGQRQRDRVLATRLAAARTAYDYVVVDCSPSLSLMNQNALVMSDAVLCPVACDYLSLVGVQKVVRTVKQVNRLLSHPINFWGVLPTFFDTRARICHEAHDTLKDHFKAACLPPVRAAMRVKEAPSQGKTLFEYAPGSSAALDYMNTVDRVLEHEVDAVTELVGGAA